MHYSNFETFKKKTTKENYFSREKYYQSMPHYKINNRKNKSKDGLETGDRTNYQSCDWFHYYSCDIESCPSDMSRRVEKEKEITVLISSW